MTGKETYSTTQINMFRDGKVYDQYLRSRGEVDIGSRAKGFLNPDGTIDVVIDKSYYLRGGIKEEELQAIVKHEQIELTSVEPDKHLAGTVVEYSYILNRFGGKALHKYHANLCNLMGGRNDTRNFALKTVLGK